MQLKKGDWYMSSKYNNITNVLINKDILLTNKIRKQL